MNTQAKNLIIYGALLLAGTYFLFQIIIKGQPFFAPLVIAILLAMLLVPIANKMEHWGISRGWAAFLSDMVLIIFTLLLFWVIGLQIKQVQEDWPQLKKELIKKAETVDETMSNYSLVGDGGFNFKEKLQQVVSAPGQGQQQEGQQQNQQQEQQGNQQQGNQQQGNWKQNQQQNPQAQTQQQGSQQQTGSGGMLQQVWMVLKSFFGFIGNMLLVFIYIFFFLLYRKKFQNSVLNFAPGEKKEKTNEVISDASNVAQQYLFGKLILIIFLAVLYSIGLSIAGIKYALFISVIAAVLSLIPYIGNIIGFSFAALMALLSGGGGGSIIGVVITFSIAQFIESYILEPFIVGHKVELNPAMTIIAIIFGEFIWGIPGMVLALPVLGILKVIWDHIPALQPLGYAVGEEDIGGGDSGFKKVEQWIQKKFK